MWGRRGYVAGPAILLADSDHFRRSRRGVKLRRKEGRKKKIEDEESAGFFVTFTLCCDGSECLCPTITRHFEAVLSFPSHNIPCIFSHFQLGISALGLDFQLVMG